MRRRRRETRDGAFGRVASTSVVVVVRARLLRVRVRSSVRPRGVECDDDAVPAGARPE